jgi:hypothetical protein
MRKRSYVLIASCTLVGLVSWLVAAERLVPIPLERYLDKLKGGWAGQMIGVSYGAPYEFKSNGKIYDGPIREWKPEYIENTIHQDDLYVEMTFLQAIEAKGLDISTREAGWFFRDSKYSLWHANRAARDNLRAGIPAPDSGHPKYNRHADDIDFQIESDLFGLICPGMPLAAQELSDRFGHIMNYGDGVYGGMFVTSMLAAAFFEDDIRTIVEVGYHSIPPNSEYGLLVKDILDCHERYPEDWRGCWRLLEDKWAQDDICAPGNPFNIDAKLNGGYIAVGLLWGGGDWDKTLEITTRCGQDADCNPSNAAGVLGVIGGYGRIPQKYTAGIPDIANQNFSYTDYNFNTLADTCAKYAIQIIERNGGKIESRDGREILLIPVQEPKPPKKLEQFTDEMVSKYKPYWEKQEAEAQRKHMESAVKEWDPEWTLVACGREMDPGRKNSYLGRSNVLLTHPVDRETPAILERVLKIPKNKSATLRLVVTNHEGMRDSDWELRVKVNGEVIATERIARKNGQAVWHTFEYDLSRDAGKKIKVELENAANDWSFEGGYWAEAKIEMP